VSAKYSNDKVTLRKKRTEEGPKWQTKANLKKELTRKWMAKT